MKLKGFFQDISTLSRLFLLLFLVLAGNLLSSFLALGILHTYSGGNAEILQSPNMVRLLQFITATDTFLIPAFLWGWLCSNSVKEYLFIKNIPNAKVLWFALLGLLMIEPTISLTEFLNKQVTFPGFLEPVENWMREKEEAIKQLTMTLLSEKGVFAFAMNIIVIAITAAVTEEFLFRGALQRIVGKWIPNYHVAIWVVAFIFSAFHLQFYGLIPRMLIGAYLGYLLYWSKTIWLPVLIHFANNAIAVIVMSNGNLKEYELITGELSKEAILSLTIVSIIGLTLFYFVVRKLKTLLA